VIAIFMFAIRLIFGILCILLAVITPLFIIGVIFCTPYWLMLGCYKADHNLSNDFRKYSGPNQEIKYAFQFYNDILHLRKPSFEDTKETV
jgi:hypothetical protein